MRKLVIPSLLFAVFGNAAAHAHGFLDHASPLVGGTVGSAPREVVLTYTQNLEAGFSSVEVADANGAHVDQGKPQISGNTMRVV
jgi:copper resistance protein C